MAKPYQYSNQALNKKIPPTPIAAVSAGHVYYRVERQGQWAYQIIQLKDGVETKIGPANLLSVVEGKLVELLQKSF